MYALALDILFISSRGSQYRYYKALAKGTSFIARVVTLFPCFGFKVFDSGLSRTIISNGIAFHLERKRRKYKQNNVNIVVFKLYEWFSVLYFSLVYLKFRFYFERFQPSVVCIWNGHRLPEMAIKAAIDGFNIEIAYFENGLLPDTTTLDFSGVNALSSLPKEPEFYLDYYHKLNDSERVSINKRLVARKPHKKRASLVFQEFDLSQEYLFVPFQVNFDSQVVINSPRVNSMNDLYLFVEQAVKELGNRSPFFLIKEHPSDVRSYPELHYRNPKIIFVDDDTEDLIVNALAVITLNSSVGIEAVLLEKKVIVLGDACYSIDSVVNATKDLNEFLECVQNIDTLNINTQVRASFLTYLYKEYLLPGNWQNMQDTVTVDHLSRFEIKMSRFIKNG